MLRWFIALCVSVVASFVLVFLGHVLGVYSMSHIASAIAITINNICFFVMGAAVRSYLINRW